VGIVPLPAPTVRHSMLATLCALTGILMFTGAAAQAANTTSFGGCPPSSRDKNRSVEISRRASSLAGQSR
jgi:hypothetical protein